MNYLLDTCVLSEFTRRKPDVNVIRWVDNIAEDNTFLSVITIGEIQRGIERLSDSQRKNELTLWLNKGLVERFAQRILPLDNQTMLLWGSMGARTEKSALPLAVMDALIAATALRNNLVLVTCNVSDLLTCGVQMANPWS